MHRLPYCTGLLHSHPIPLFLYLYSSYSSTSNSALLCLPWYDVIPFCSSYNIAFVLGKVGQERWEGSVAMATSRRHWTEQCMQVIIILMFMLILMLMLILMFMLIFMLMPIITLMIMLTLWMFDTVLTLLLQITKTEVLLRKNHDAIRVRYVASLPSYTLPLHTR